MNELEFYRGLEGEDQQLSDLMAGAEHLIRLKIQSGQQTEPRYEDLELKKQAMGNCFHPPKRKEEEIPESAGSEALFQHLNTKVAQPEWNRAMLAATTGIGALAGGLGTYLASRPKKDTGKSKMEEELEAQVQTNRSKPADGFLRKLKDHEIESAHGLAKIFREHPNKAALIGLLAGAMSGYGIGQVGGAIARRGGH